MGIQASVLQASGVLPEPLLKSPLTTTLSSARTPAGSTSGAARLIPMTSRTVKRDAPAGRDHSGATFGQWNEAPDELMRRRSLREINSNRGVIDGSGRKTRSIFGLMVLHSIVPDISGVRKDCNGPAPACKGSLLLWSKPPVCNNGLGKSA